jgi:xanthine dehydrogenase YagS FAD-binding subunit
MNRIQWANATTVDEAVAEMAAGAVLKAGGVDLADLMKEGLVEPQRLVNIRRVRGLDRVDEDAEGLRIGPLVTLAQLAEHPAVRRRCRALAEAAGHAATPQIRNMATLGGNLLQRPRCWYFRSEGFHCKRKGGEHCFAIFGENAYHAIFDNDICAIVHPSATATALVAHGAVLRLMSPTGAREVALESIFVRPEKDVKREHDLGPADMITEVRVPAMPPGAASSYTKLGEKASYDWPIAEVACVLGRDGGRVTSASVVLGAAAPVPWRAKEAEAILTGRPLGEETARAAARAAVTGARPLSGNGYKIQVLEAVARRTILAAMNEEAR